MVGSIDPRCETVRGTHWPVKVAGVFGTRVAENHLGQRSKRPASTGRTYGCKRSDQTLKKTLAARGPSTYGSLLSQGRRVERAMPITKETPRAFTDIDTWVFDLDNTLYPHHVNLWQQVDVRIGEFVAAWLKGSPEEARRIQKAYYRRYGTTMRGMMTEHGVRADDYLAYAHQIDHSPLELNPAMGA